MIPALAAPEQSLQEWRCRWCNRLLARMRLASGSVIEIKCSNDRCGKFNTREVSGGAAPLPLAGLDTKDVR